MPRFNVEKDNKWACFSTIVDDFITHFMPLEMYEEWRQKEYGANCGSVYKANLMSYDEAMEIIEMRKMDMEVQNEY